MNENPFWALIAGEPLPCAREQGCGVQRTVTRNHRGYHLLHPAIVRQVEHRRFGDVGILQQNLLDFARIDILAAGDDHVALAVEDGEIALVVDAAEIAGAQPAVLHHAPGRIRIAPVARHGHRAFHQDLADRILIRFVRRREFDRDVGERPPAGEQQVFVSRARLAMGLRRETRHRSGFGRAVTLRKLAREGRGRALQRANRHRRRGIEDHAQRRQIEVADIRLLQHSVDHGRHEMRVGHAMPRHQLQHALRIELRHDHRGAAGSEARKQVVPHATDMKERHRRERHVRIGEVEHLFDRAPAVEQEPAMGQFRALRNSGGAACIEQAGGVIR